jgi:hypothetical protein
MVVCNTPILSDPQPALNGIKGTIGEDFGRGGTIVAITTFTAITETICRKFMSMMRGKVGSRSVAMKRYKFGARLNGAECRETVGLRRK